MRRGFGFGPLVVLEGGGGWGNLILLLGGFEFGNWGFEERGEGDWLGWVPF